MAVAWAEPSCLTHHRVIATGGKLNILSTMQERMKKKRIQARAMWLPNHLQKPYRKYETYKISFANYLKNTALCIPSSSHLTISQMESVINILKN